MKPVLKKKLALIASCLYLSACGYFSGLKENLEQIESDYLILRGIATSETCNDCVIAIAVLSGPTDLTVSRYTLVKNEHEFTFAVPREDSRLFFFADSNQNLRFDNNESYAWLSVAEIKAQTSGTVIPIQLKPHQSIAPAITLGKLTSILKQSIPLQSGTLTTLSNPIFSPENASQGMWRPADFVLAGKTGVYFLEEYSTTKTPVLFVHGIGGNPTEFTTMIDGLDRSKYQPWVFFYPSGFDLSSIAGGLERIMTELLIRYKPAQVHIIAHSMGGLIARKTIGSCDQGNLCNALVSFTSIASPFGGHASAQGGVDYAPVVMPVWNDMAPSSQFLQTLPTSALPASLKHHLVIAYLAGESSDSVIEIASQLHQPIQAQASSVRGFEGSHTGVLKDPEVIQYVFGLW